MIRYLEEHVKNERFNTKLAKEKLKKLRHIAMQQQDDIVKTERAKSHKIDPKNPCVLLRAPLQGRTPSLNKLSQGAVE